MKQLLTKPGQFLQHIIQFVLVTAVLVAPYISVQAYNPRPIVFDPGYRIANTTQLGNEDPIAITAGIINWILSFLLIIALVLVLYGGFTWMLSAGNEEKVGTAKDVLLGAVIGLAIILASYGVTVFVFEGLLNATARGVN